MQRKVIELAAWQKRIEDDHASLARSHGHAKRTIAKVSGLFEPTRARERRLAAYCHIIEVEKDRSQTIGGKAPLLAASRAVVGRIEKVVMRGAASHGRHRIGHEDEQFGCGALAQGVCKLSFAVSTLLMLAFEVAQHLNLLDVCGRQPREKLHAPRERE